MTRSERLWVLVLFFAWLAGVNCGRVERLQDEARELRLRTCPRQVDRLPERPWRAPAGSPAVPLFL